MSNYIVDCIYYLRQKITILRSGLLTEFYKAKPSSRNGLTVPDILMQMENKSKRQ